MNALTRGSFVIAGRTGARRRRQYSGRGYEHCNSCSNERNDADAHNVKLRDDR